MALTLPYPGMDFTPLDILTADEMDHLVANIEYLANNILSSTVLYSGSQTGDVTLSSDVTQYTYIEIFANENGGRKIYLKLYSPAVSDRFCIGQPFIAVQNSIAGLYFRGKTYEISTTTKFAVVADGAGQITVPTSGAITSSLGNTTILIRRVVGYK